MFEKFVYWLHKEHYKNFTKEDQRYLYLRSRHWHMTAIISTFIIALIILALQELLILISKDIIVAIVSTLPAGIFFYQILKNAYKIAGKVYPVVITKRGKALSKENFKEIKKNSASLYNAIMSDKCCGKCYYVCWAILHILRKGHIQFIAVRDFYAIDEEKMEKYKIHVLYVNKNWCFDTYSQRQMPVEELYEIWRGKFIDSYDYVDIANKSFEEFRDSIAPNLRKWCKENDCRYFINR